VERERGTVAGRLLPASFIRGERHERQSAERCASTGISAKEKCIVLFFCKIKGMDGTQRCLTDGAHHLPRQRIHHSTFTGDRCWP
jgi:hypothetical protein